jgi:hypothetical protein
MRVFLLKPVELIFIRLFFIFILIAESLFGVIKISVGEAINKSYSSLRGSCTPERILFGGTTSSQHETFFVAGNGKINR